MLDATPSFSQLLMDWDAPAASSSAGEMLFDLLGPLPVDEPACESLEDDVDETRLAKRRKSSGVSGARKDGGRLSVWERVAKHQAELRQKAETENAKLCGLVEKRKKQAQKIEKAIHHRALEAQTREAVCERQVSASLVEATSSTNWQNTKESPLWRQIFDRVFNNDDFWMEDPDRDEVNVTSDTSGQTVIEHAHCKTYPFDLVRTSKAVWKTYGSDFMDITGGYYSATRASDDLLVAECQVALEMGGNPLVLRSDFRIRKLVEQPKRVVIVWENWPCPDDKIESDATSRVCLSLDVCVCMDEVRSSVDSDDVATMALVVSVSKPAYTGPKLNNRILVAGDGLVQSYSESNRRFDQLVESHLLDESLGLRTITAAK